MNKSKSCRVLICNNSFHQNINAYSDYSCHKEFYWSKFFAHIYWVFRERSLCCEQQEIFFRQSFKFKASLCCSDWLVVGVLVSPLAPLASPSPSTLEYEAGYEAESVKAQSSDKNRPLVGQRTPTSAQLTTWRHVYSVTNSTSLSYYQTLPSLIKMKTVEKYLQKYLAKLGYLQLSKCKSDLLDTLKIYNSLGKFITFWNEVYITLAFWFLIPLHLWPHVMTWW